VGHHESLRQSVGDTRMFDYIVSGIVALFLLVYLGWAMFKPEKF
jgi:K+-transporting ATPase KdpF subunit